MPKHWARRWIPDEPIALQWTQGTTPASAWGQTCPWQHPSYQPQLISGLSLGTQAQGRQKAGLPTGPSSPGVPTATPQPLPFPRSPQPGGTGLNPRPPALWALCPGPYPAQLLCLHILHFCLIKAMGTHDYEDWKVLPTLFIKEVMLQ